MTKPDEPAPGIRLHNADVVGVISSWPEPDAVVADPPYGLGGFEHDPETTDEGLVEYYRRFVQPLTDAAGLGTHLWWWSSEESWAWAHTILDECGWDYRGFNVWDKGLQHAAGRTNTNTMRKFPTVTEACVHYQRNRVRHDDNSRHMRDILRNEWKRAGLSFKEANDACGVANAASRKYLAPDDKWYPPPPERFADMKEYANKHGEPEGRPYFDGDRFEGVADMSAGVHRLTSFELPAGVTNVWEEPPLPRSDRVTTGDGEHIAQKPLALIDRVLSASTEAGDVVWAPFGGVYTTAVWCARNNRRCHSAEIDEEYHEAGVRRVESAAAGGLGATGVTIDAFADGDGGDRR